MKISCFFLSHFLALSLLLLLSLSSPICSFILSLLPPFNLQFSLLPNVRFFPFSFPVCSFKLYLLPNVSFILCLFPVCRFKLRLLLVCSCKLRPLPLVDSIQLCILSEFNLRLRLLSVVTLSSCSYCSSTSVFRSGNV